MPNHSKLWSLPLVLFLLLLAACGWEATGQDVGDADVSDIPAAPAYEVASETPLPPAVAIVTTTTATPAPAPGGTPTGISQPEPAPTAQALVATPGARIFLPITSQLPAAAMPPATSTPAPSPTPSPSPTPTIDFRAVRAQLQANNQDLAFAKIGFHVGPGGNMNGIGTWMHRLDEAGVPFFLKSVDTSGPLVEAQEIMAESDVPHTLVYRTSGVEYDVPEYSLPPAEAARRHWERHKASIPPELDPSRVWIETINEVDAGQAEWLAEFALATAQLTLAEGYRWAAFGWASGEPEPEDWQSTAMLQFLRLAAANPDRLAIALHEYSYLAEDIAHEYPYKVGRFQQLLQICDQYGIPRPTVLITEWGWEYQNVPGTQEALDDIAWAAEMYAPYPQVKGAAIWYLGPGFADIAHQAQKLIAPVTEYSLGNYYPAPLPPAQAPIEPERYRP